MSANDGMRGPQVVLSLPKSDKLLIGYGKGILVSLTGNTAFPSPNPTLAAFESDLDAYDKAETLAATRTKGAVQQRGAKRQKVVAGLNHLRDYVQGVVEGQASPADAAAMIASAGMRVRKVGKHNKAALRARNAGTSGAVLLDAKAVAPVATYYWQHSVDQATWLDVPETMQASTVITGLTPGQRYYFQFRTLTRAGASDFSQVVSLIVL